MTSIRPLQVVARGLAAGLVGTACMTVLQEVMARRHRRAVAMGHPMEDIDPWERAPAPAKLARMVSERALHLEIPAERISFFTNAVHWAFGAQMGIAYALVQTLARGRPTSRGPLFGLAVWAQSYATLVPLGLYKWPWHYRAGAITKDVSYHLLYGSGVAAGYQLVTRRK